MTQASIPPLARRTHTIGDAIAAHLEGLIFDGTLAAGSRLPSERALAESLGVSRTTVRQALHELARKHLITRRHGAGSTVAVPSEKEQRLQEALQETDVTLLNALELRRLIEPGIAAAAAERATPSNLLQLDEILAQSNESLSAEESLRLDELFHETLARAAQNPLLAALCRMTNEWTHDTRLASHSTQEGRRVSLAGHRAIHAALSNGDPDAAHRAMLDHLTDVRAISRTA